MLLHEIIIKESSVTDATKLASQYIASKKGNNKEHTAELWRKLEAVVGVEKAEDMVKSQDFN